MKGHKIPFLFLGIFECFDLHQEQQSKKLGLSALMQNQVHLEIVFGYPADSPFYINGSLLNR